MPQTRQLVSITQPDGTNKATLRVQSDVIGQKVPLLSHILVGAGSGTITVHEGYQATGAPLWRKENTRDGDVYVLNCPCPQGFYVELNGGTITVIWENGRAA